MPERSGSHDTFTVEGHYPVPDQRLVYAYEMYVAGRRISVSRGTVELAPAVDGTRLAYTQQGAFLDGLDRVEQRQLGT